ncbi:protein translocase subunit SecF, partial [Dehalococcoidia bacterium]|nr:protein translocase subunit SecF [Dehalococcoidia bacterium]
GFFFGAKDMPATAREDLVEELETLFGLAERTSFSRDDDMAVRVRVADPVAALEKVNETLLVQKMGPNRFLLAASGMPEEDQGFLFATVQQAFGDIGQTRYNFSTDLATTITFSEPIQPVSEASVRSALEDRGYTGLVMVDQGDDTFFLRGARPSGDQKGKIINTLEATFGEINPESIEFSFVDAEIARRSVVNTFIAVLGGSVGILLYVWWAFRRTPKPFRFGVAAVIGLVHDAVVVLGAFGIMAKFRGVEIDSLLVIGLLAVIGYSVNNTIVVLDRIRENVTRNPGRDFDGSVNFSLNETLSRNLNTALTTGVAILAVALFGGGTIFNFMLVLLIGVGAGTYSSLCLAANVLVSWDKGELGGVFRLPWIRRREVSQR